MFDAQDNIMDKTNTRTHTFESASFTARATELAWTFHRPYDTVWDAVVEAASMTGLAVISADRRVGMAVARPPFSLLNIGRRVAFTFSRSDEDSTLVRATLLHGYMALQSRRSRQRSLDTVLHMALELIRRDDKDAQTLREARERATHIGNAGRKGVEQEVAGSAGTTASTASQTPSAPEPAAIPPSARPNPPESATQHAPSADPGTAVAPAKHAGPDHPQGNVPRSSRADAPPDAHPTANDLNALDFGGTDWENLPLTPPSGPEASRYRHRPPDDNGSGMGKAILWFVLGLGLAFGLSVMAGGLSMLLD